MLQDTRILITIQVVDDTRSIMVLLALATAIFETLAGLVATICLVALAIGDEISLWIDAARMTAKVVSIGVNSLSFGLGVTQ